MRTAPTKAHPLGFRKDNGQPKVRRSSEQVKKGVEVLKKPAHQRREKPNNYLKYHRIVMAWARQNYKISTAHLELIFFLYDEDIFTKTKMKDYAMIMPFDRNKLGRMIDEGWIRTWRSDTDHRFAYYELTMKAKRLYTSVVAKLEGREKISEFSDTNEMLKNTNSKHWAYSIAIKKMNKKIDDKAKKERHPTRTDWDQKKRRGKNKNGNQ